MIPFDFEYHRPTSLAEAVALFERLRAEGKAPLYYTGGTEIITLGRLHLLRTGAVVDVKGIPECQALHAGPERLTIGGAVTLTDLTDGSFFPLLGRTAGQVADRTARNKITLAGNICSAFIYREAILPLLVADAALVLAGPEGVRTLSVHQAFDQQFRLPPGNMVVQVLVDPHMTRLPFYHTKRRRMGNVGYPVVTLAALKQGAALRVALSGVCDFPFRSRPMEAALSETGVPAEERVERALQLLPGPVRDDLEASAEYRVFVLRGALLDALHELEGGT